jgi:predicted transcriptional regulator of viral defense system
MKYIELVKNIKEPVFSLQDLKLTGIKVYPYQLSDWTDKGYIVRLKNGLYLLSDKKKEVLIEHIAFMLYQPSYISLEWALSRHGLIPEMVYNPTSVTAKTTRTFSNEFSTFYYRHIKKELFTGYERYNINEQPYLMASAEKALFDYVYFNIGQINNIDDIEELRFNPFELKKLKKKILYKYASIANNKKVMDIIKLIVK